MGHYIITFTSMAIEADSAEEAYDKAGEFKGGGTWQAEEINLTNTEHDWEHYEAARCVRCGVTASGSYPSDLTEDQRNQGDCPGRPEEEVTVNAWPEHDLAPCVQSGEHHASQRHPLTECPTYSEEGR